MNISDNNQKLPPEQINVLGSNTKVGVVQPLVYWPDARLKQKCKDIMSFGNYTKTLARNLYATMEKNRGVGISAPQIGYTLNMILIKESSEPKLLINPQILKIGDNCTIMTEGCLSVPGYYEKRSRSDEIEIKYKTINDEEIIKTFKGLEAFIIQHEIEHLEGKVFIDNLSNFKKNRILNKINKTIKFK